MLVQLYAAAAARCMCYMNTSATSKRMRMLKTKIIMHTHVRTVSEDSRSFECLNADSMHSMRSVSEEDWDMNGVNALTRHAENECGKTGTVNDVKRRKR